VKDSSPLMTAHNEPVARIEADGERRGIARGAADEKDGRVADAVG
jgi:hypothetical protein